jgi:hypothetical protein
MQFRLKLQRIKKNVDEPLPYAAIFNEALKKYENIKEICMKDERPKFINNIREFTVFVCCYDNILLNTLVHKCAILTYTRLEGVWGSGSVDSH